MAFPEMGDLNFIDAKDAVNLEMQPGEFVLFNERTLHHSEPNRSDRRRIGLAVRVIIPIVKVLKWDSPNHTETRLSDKLQGQISASLRKAQAEIKRKIILPWGASSALG